MDITRLLILAAAALVVAGVVVAGQLLAQRRRARLQSAPTEPLWDALGAAPDGRPTIVAFSTPGCAVCRTAQAPALSALERELGDAVRILKVDAAERPDVADAFGVLTVPTTVVLSPAGKVATINNGFATTARLRDQLRGIPIG